MNQEKRSKSLTIWLQPAEYDALKTRVQESNCRHLSIFARRCLLGKPITLLHRNASLDDVMEALSQLKPGLDQLIQALEKGEHPDVESLRESYLQTQNLIYKAADLWLQ